MANGINPSNPPAPDPNVPIEQSVFNALTAREATEASTGDQVQTQPHDPGERINITEADAATLISQGFVFPPTDDVTVHALGTHMGNDLEDLSDLGVDHIESDPATRIPGVDDNQGDILLTLGLDLNTGTTAAAHLAELRTVLQSFNEPVFNEDAKVGLTVVQAEAAAFAAATPQEQQVIATQLVDLGVDFVKIVGVDQAHLDDPNPTI
jgi:hypothetical protein